jgi:hypothetical protein
MTDNSQLATAINFIQYTTKNKQKIITIIGEYHNYNFNCINNKEISQYCLERANSNDYCSILLEYSKYDNPKTIGSKTINTTYNKLLKNKQQNHIVPVDYRTLFLKFKGQSDLYDIDWHKVNYSKNKIKKIIIQPFFTLVKKILTLNSKHYDLNSFININNYIKHTIEPEFLFILQHLENFQIIPLQQELKLTWNKVMDIGILMTVLKKSKNNEFIIIAGNRHCTNLQKMINTTFKSNFNFILQQLGDKGKCIKLKGTLTSNNF